MGSESLDALHGYLAIPQSATRYPVIEGGREGEIEGYILVLSFTAGACMCACPCAVGARPESRTVRPNDRVCGSSVS